MDPMTCPHCRRPADRPMFFPKAQQQVFNYIWEHPRCTIADIEKALWGRNASSNLVSVYITKIRDNLIGTSFCVVSEFLPKSGHGCRHPRRYTIALVKAPTNANV